MEALSYTKRGSSVNFKEGLVFTWGGTVVFPGWFLGKFQGGFAFYLMSLTCIV